MNIETTGYNSTSFTEAIKTFEKAHKLKASELKEDKDWREMSDKQWEKLLKGVDKQVDAFKEHLERMKEMQDEAMRKAAAMAAPDMKAIAASAAALKVAANGLMPTTNGSDEMSKDWTKNLSTDDQVILTKAKIAEEKASDAVAKWTEIQAGNGINLLRNPGHKMRHALSHSVK